jgi:hypothetical protein
VWNLGVVVVACCKASSSDPFQIYNIMRHSKLVHLLTQSCEKPSSGVLKVKRLESQIHYVFGRKLSWLLGEGKLSWLLSLGERENWVGFFLWERGKTELAFYYTFVYRYIEIHYDMVSHIWNLHSLYIKGHPLIICVQGIK